MKNQNTNNANLPLIKRMIKSIKGAWRSYSQAVDMAYNRCQTYEDVAEAQLCCESSQQIALKPNKRPAKAAAFDDYSSIY